MESRGEKERFESGDCAVSLIADKPCCTPAWRGGERGRRARKAQVERKEQAKRASEQAVTSEAWVESHVAGRQAALHRGGAA